ncbi:SPOR domain-containing protein [Roseovarius salis]|uniref:SPOR domain-containing protein n=1 Tax=Roseovarius salis TaxID=3376063 RepID=UPI0037CAE277
MADMHEPYHNGESERSGRLRAAANLLGAVTSLALLVGTAIWGYKMVVRDVSGVPVIKAAAGPMRVQPDEPGGRQAQHQGLSVNEIAAGGAAGEPADRLILAPEPLELSLDEAALADTGADDGARDDGGAAMRSAAEAEGTSAADIEAIAEEVAEGVAPLEDLEPSNGERSAGRDLAAADTGTVEGGLGRSLRPKMRPQSLMDGPEAVTRAAAQVASVRDIDPDTIPAGTRLAQLGAFASRSVAEEQWTKLAERFDGYLADKDRVIQKATSGGRTFYRLRAMGFEDISHARRFCSALVDQNADCIPVVVR